MAEKLELIVTKNIVGVLETNIESLEMFVDEKLKSYDPAGYLGDADEAKKDRAELNNSKKFLSQSRINLMKELMKPYSDFEIRCKALEKKIDLASSKLDEIVKVKENEEKAAKKEYVEEVWSRFNFDLVPLSKVFNPKWLNKTCKEPAILAEMEEITNRIYDDLKTIEKYAENDTDVLKAYYLDCLSVSDTLDYGQQLEKNRQKAKEEAEQRAEREKAEKIAEQKQELRQEVEIFSKDCENKSLLKQAVEAAGETMSVEEPKEYLLNLKLIEVELIGLKDYLNQSGIVYDIQELSF